MPATVDLTFFHRFEQRGLNLGGCAINLVGEHKVVEDRLGLETKLTFTFGGVVNLEPVMSDGRRSGVTWMRESPASRNVESFLMARVLASPGSPSTRRLPLASRPMRSLSIIAS
ncbi:MAG TPA: hypothetical protein VIX42_00605 [Edaphobacter sp.]